MSNEETNIQRRIQLDLTDKDTRAFRNNVGVAYQGDTFSVVRRRVVSGYARTVAYGLAPGSSDLIVPHSVIVTPGMVGMRLLVFGAIEVKDAGRPSPEQRQFIKVINDLGGLAGVAHDSEQAREIIYRLDGIK